jgi:hypothetical protein
VNRRDDGRENREHRHDQIDRRGNFRGKAEHSHQDRQPEFAAADAKQARERADDETGDSGDAHMGFRPVFHPS